MTFSFSYHFDRCYLKLIGINLSITIFNDALQPDQQPPEEWRTSSLVVIKGVAHLSNIEKPVDFNKAVLDFLLD